MANSSSPTNDTPTTSDNSSSTIDASTARDLTTILTTMNETITTINSSIAAIAKENTEASTTIKWFEYFSWVTILVMAIVTCIFCFVIYIILLTNSGSDKKQSPPKLESLTKSPVAGVVENVQGNLEPKSGDNIAIKSGDNGVIVSDDQVINSIVIKKDNEKNTQIEPVTHEQIQERTAANVSDTNSSKIEEQVISQVEVPPVNVLPRVSDPKTVEEAHKVPSLKEMIKTSTPFVISNLESDRPSSGSKTLIKSNPNILDQSTANQVKKSIPDLIKSTKSSEKEVKTMEVQEIKEKSPSLPVLKSPSGPKLKVVSIPKLQSTSVPKLKSSSAMKLKASTIMKPEVSYLHDKTPVTISKTEYMNPTGKNQISATSTAGPTFSDWDKPISPVPRPAVVSPAQEVNKNSPIKEVPVPKFKGKQKLKYKAIPLKNLKYANTVKQMVNQLKAVAKAKSEQQVGSDGSKSKGSHGSTLSAEDSPQED